MLRRPPFLVAALVVGASVIPCDPAPGAACLIAPSRQEAGEGQIYGHIIQADGDAASQVTVRLASPGLPRPREARTLPGGAYLLSGLAPGVYRLAAEREACLVAGIVEVSLQAGERVRVDLSIDAAGCRERAAVVKVESASLRDGIEVVDALPADLLGRLPLRPGLLAAWFRLQPAQVAEDGLSVESVGAGLALDPPLGWLQEVVVVRAGARVRAGANAGEIGLITRRPRGAFTGSARYSLSDRRLAWDNRSAVLREQGVNNGSRVLRASEAEAEVGGTLVPRRALWWASAGRSRREEGIVGYYRDECLDGSGLPLAAASERADCLVPDVVVVSTAGARLDLAWSGSQESLLSWAWSSRSNTNRGASVCTRPEATTRQHGLGHAGPLRVLHRWAPTERLAVEGRYSYSGRGYALALHDPALAGVQAAYDRYTLARWRSATEFTRVRRSHDLEVQGRWFQPAWLHGDHLLEFGFQQRDDRQRETDRAGGGAVAVFDSRGGRQAPWQARILRDGNVVHDAHTWSAFLQDSFTTDRLTLEVGVRFDHRDDAAGPSAIPASAIVPDVLPGLRFSGADSGVVYRDASPRFGLAWDPAGRGRTLVKVTAARTTAEGNDTSSLLQATGPTRLVYWWNDANGDTFVQGDELDFARGLAATPSSNYDPAHPSAAKTPSTVDPALKNVTTAEVAMRVEQRVTRAFTLHAGYVGRRTSRFQRSFRVEPDGSPVRSDTFVPVEWTPPRCAAGAQCPSVVYYTRDRALPSGTLLRNDGEYAWQHGVEIGAHKRLAHGWMLDARLALRQAAWRAPAPTRDYTDPTNIDMRNGTEYSTSEPQWSARVAGTLRLPAGFGVASVLTGRQGEVFEPVVSSPTRGALGPARVSIERYGVERYPDAWQLDARLDWECRIGRLTVVPTLDAFNVLNAGTILARNRVQNSEAANRVTRIAAPRSLQLAVAVQW